MYMGDLYDAPFLLNQWKLEWGVHMGTGLAEDWQGQEIDPESLVVGDCLGNKEEKGIESPMEPAFLSKCTLLSRTHWPEHLYKYA